MLSEEGGSRWQIAYIPQAIGAGIIGILIPLYMIQELHASLIDLGTMTFASSLLLIPASLYLGSLPDRYQLSKPFILASFLGVSIILYIMSNVTNVLLFQLLYIAMELVNYIRGPSTTIFIAETYSKKARSRIIARQGFTDSIGAVIGLTVCILTIDTLGYHTLLTYAAPLFLISFILALVTIREPSLYIERNFDRFDRIIDNMDEFSHHLNDQGTFTPDTNGRWSFSGVANMKLFSVGRAIFAFAASNAFNMLSIFLLTKADLSSSMVFIVYQVRSIVGALSYLFVNRIAGTNGSRSVKLGTMIRIVIVSLFPFVLILPKPGSLILAAVLLSMTALSWSIYAVGVETVVILNAAPGSLGFFDAMTSMGGALGNYTGGLIPSLFGFVPLFLFSSILFALALLIFYISLKKTQ